MIVIISSNHLSYIGRLMMKEESWVGKTYKRVGNLYCDADWAWLSNFNGEVIVYSPIVWECFNLEQGGGR